MKRAVIKEKINAKDVDLEACIPEKAQARLVFEWRNEEISRKMSYNSFFINWGAFWKSFRDEYFNIKDLTPLFILYKKNRVGFMRFELIKNPFDNKEHNCVMVIINMSKDFRGRGIGSVAIKKALSLLLSKGIDVFFADIKKENYPSQKAFINAGFKFLQERPLYKNIIGEDVKILRYIWEE